MGIISQANKDLAIKAIEDLGLVVTFGKHVDECDLMLSSSIHSRLDDLHEAFEDKTVQGILTVIGGYNSNQLLEGIDYNLIKKNPKILCGFSDITALSNAIYHKTNLVTYSGVHFSSFGMQKGFEYSLEYFKKIFFSSETIQLLSSTEWSDDAWYLNQVDRVFHKNSGYQVIQPGRATGRIVGGNLGTFQLLRGTPYMPSLEDTILFLEEVANLNSTNVEEFDRNFQSLLQAPDFKGVRGLVIGRFENEFGMDEEKLRFLISTKAALRNLPIIANTDFGHTTPIFTFPIGGIASFRAQETGKVNFIIERH